MDSMLIDETMDTTATESPARDNPVPDPTTLAQRERRALADLLLQVGPEAPTMCEGWMTYDLVAHLWTRETEPAAMLGAMGGPFAGLADARRERAKQQHAYEELVELVRSGPRPGSPLRRFDQSANTLEFLVHHEDVRRGADLSVPAREMSYQDDQDIVGRLGVPAQLRLGRRGVQTVLVDQESGHVVRVGQGAVVTVTGPPTELALYVFGRRAHVDVHGPVAPDGPDD